MNGAITGLFLTGALLFAAACGTRSPQSQEPNEPSVAGEDSVNPGQNNGGSEQRILLGEEQNGEPDTIAEDSVNYTPLELVESMRKALIKMQKSRSQTLKDGESLVSLSVWKVDKDIAIEIGVASESEKKRVLHQFCHYHGEKLACHTIQPPGLSGNPQPFLSSSEEESLPLAPIDPFL